MKKCSRREEKKRRIVDIVLSCAIIILGIVMLPTTPGLSVVSFALAAEWILCSEVVK